MVKKIKNPFLEYRGKDKLSELMKRIHGNVAELSADIKNKLNGDNVMDYLDGTYEIFDDIWNYLMIQAFVDQDEIEVVPIADLATLMDHDFEMESCGIDAESGERYVLFRMLPEDVREQLTRKSPSTKPVELTDRDSWLDK